MKKFNATPNQFTLIILLAMKAIHDDTSSLPSKISLDILSMDIMIRIFNFLDKNDVIRVSHVSKKCLELTADKSLLHHFWHRDTGWSQQPHYHDRKNIKFSQVSYTQKRIHSDMQQIVINFYQHKNTICFQTPKHIEKFESKLLNAHCKLEDNIYGFFKTKDYSKALLAVRDDLPSKLLETINKDIKEGDAIIKQYYEEKAIEKEQIEFGF